MAISLWHVPSRNQKGEMIMRICLNVCTERERGESVHEGSASFRDVGG